MIIIKTENGDSLVNENEVQHVSHNKKYAYVYIKFKDGHVQSIYQVREIVYTNKANVEISDSSWMLTSAISDANYYMALNQSACDYLKRMDEYRSKLERMVNEMYEKPDANKEYREHFVKKMREAQNERPNNIMGELDEYRKAPYYIELRKESREKGEEVKKEFARLTAQLGESEEWRERSKRVTDLIMARSLWQRIKNKKVF